MAAPQKPSWIGLGTVISRATRMIGIEPCPSCRRRKQVLDRLVPRVWRSSSPEPEQAADATSSLTKAPSRKTPWR